MRTRAVLWSLAVLAACSVPGPDLPDVGDVVLGTDKWAHALLFAGVGWLWLRAYPGKAWAVALGGTAYGIAIEGWQAALPIGRSGDPLDVVADVVGLAAGIAAARWRTVQEQRSDGL